MPTKSSITHAFNKWLVSSECPFSITEVLSSAFTAGYEAASNKDRQKQLKELRDIASPKPKKK